MPDLRIALDALFPAPSLVANNSMCRRFAAIFSLDLGVARTVT
jgi:hypothetical protein